MKTYIAILRGINVSGKNMIKMDALRTALTNHGFGAVLTYIQSGNLVFSANKKSVKALEAEIQEVILKNFALEIPVFVIDAEHLKKIMDGHPFRTRTADNKLLHITFLAETPQPALVEKLNGIAYPPDEFSILEDVVYLYCPGGYGNTKFSNAFFESKLKTSATTRNVNTVMELLLMAKNLADA